MVTISHEFRCSGRYLTITGEFERGWPGSSDEPRSYDTIYPEIVTEDGRETELTDDEADEFGDLVLCGVGSW